MARRISITCTLNHEDVPVGDLFVNFSRGIFHYNPSYLQNPAAFALAPSLPLILGAQPLDGLGGLSDSAPDRWGRKLLQRAAGRTSLSEFDYLLGVNDAGRQGALRFWEDGSALTSDGGGVPVELELPELLNTAQAVERDARTVEDIAARRLFRATGSLGGARPKANVLVSGKLWLAKFPKPVGDEWDVMGWEYTLSRVASELDIETPVTALRSIQDAHGQDRHIYTAQRFDRSQSQARIPYMSAMTALEARDGEGGDWVDVVEFAREEGMDTTQLWMRAALGALTGNTDDHLRNHGFLRPSHAWVLAPCFDMNPTPDGNEHQLSLFGDHSYEPSLLWSSDVLELFDVDTAQAEQWLQRTAALLPRVPDMARGFGVDSASVSVMAPRFEWALRYL
ncbi:type II toxin-antitoxin system HipA family toxin [Rothia sp. (in: high G+C Gram-positive bacteria)]|uniref:type II toxin-antitoxin system HipA family toxin n=1 Tax=Rothia sp. (in: high G+C Gram-positive bacteria) TaxID=1885016 RepID=UPI0034D0105C